MFSESINKLMSQSSVKSAQERAAQIESMILRFNTQIQEIKPPVAQDSAISKFSQVLNSTKNEEVKFNISPPLNLSRPEIENIVKSAADKYKLDEKLLMAVIKQESGFNINAVSPAGAKGLMQLMPATAKNLGVKNIFDPVQNVQGGAKHLRGLLDRYKGNLVLALAAYNAGGGNVQKYGGVPPFKETQNYVKSVLGNYLNN